MKKFMWVSFLVPSFVAGVMLAQSQYPTENRGVATEITKADIEAMVAKMIAAGTTDEAIRTFNMANTHHVEVALVHHGVTKPGDRPVTTAPEHTVISEIYYVIKGSGTMVTDGRLEGAKEQKTSGKIGPGWSGSFKDSVSRKISEGDVIVIPPNTPHNLTEVTSEMDVLVIRIDPSKVLELK